MEKETQVVYLLNKLITSIKKMDESVKKVFGVLLRSKQLESSFNEFKNITVPYNSYYTLEKLDDLIKKNFDTLLGKRLLKEIFLALGQKPNLFELTRFDDFNFSREDSEFLKKIEEKQRSADLYERMAAKSMRDVEKDNILKKQDLNNLDENEVNSAQSADIADANYYKQEAIKLRPAKKSLEYSDNQKLFQKLSNKSNGDVKKLFNAIQDSAAYKSSKDLFATQKMSYEIFEDTLRKYLLHPEVLNNLVDLIDENVFSRPDSFADKFKGVELDYFFEFLKGQFAWTLGILPVAFCFMSQESFLKVLGVSGGLAAIPVAFSLATSEWSDVALKKAKNEAKYDLLADEGEISVSGASNLGDWSTFLGKNSLETP
jgi:hypothetical protein